jgi:hypothetical protein
MRAMVAATAAATLAATVVATVAMVVATVVATAAAMAAAMAADAVVAADMPLPWRSRLRLPPKFLRSNVSCVRKGANCQRGVAAPLLVASRV